MSRSRSLNVYYFDISDKTDRRLNKTACDLRKALALGAPIHQSCNMDKLRDRARAVELLHYTTRGHQDHDCPWEVDVQLAMGLIKSCRS